jgi:hypothetical protein
MVLQLASNVTALDLIDDSRPNNNQTGTEIRQQQQTQGSHFGLYPGYHDLPTVLDPASLHPVIRDFKTLIEDDPEIYMGFCQMFEQIPKTARYELDAAGIGIQVGAMELPALLQLKLVFHPRRFALTSICYTASTGCFNGLQHLATRTITFHSR